MNPIWITVIAVLGTLLALALLSRFGAVGSFTKMLFGVSAVA